MLGYNASGLGLYPIAPEFAARSVSPSDGSSQRNTEMKSFVGAFLVFSFATVAGAQVANNPALTKKPPGGDAAKPDNNAPGIPPNADDPAIAKPVAGQPAGGGVAAAGPSAIFAALDLDGDG